MALTTALEKGAEVTVELIVNDRRIVVVNINLLEIDDEEARTVVLAAG